MHHARPTASPVAPDREVHVWQMVAIAILVMFEICIEQTPHLKSPFSVFFGLL